MDSNLVKRRSIRLPDYDYSSAGAYFITICVRNRLNLFGEIVDETIVLNDAGCMVEKYWLKLSEKFPNVTVDEFVVMPNHFHGLIWFDLNNVGADSYICPVSGEYMDSPLRNRKTSLGRIIQWFKIMTSDAYIRNVKRADWKPFPGKLWQRNYYEHVIRNEEELNNAREYIMYNPVRWESDRENPSCMPDDKVNNKKLGKDWLI